jgi:dihydrofolate synthase/folylpolyglutamate synthase
VALAATEVVAGSLEPGRVMEVAAGLDLHGRMELRDGAPPLILDAAHNPAGARALAEALPAAAAGRPLVACAAVLADKDARGVVEALAPALDGFVATEIPNERLEAAGRPGARALGAAELAAIAREAGIGWVAEEPSPEAALSQAAARVTQVAGALLVTGSHYLLRYADS